MDVKSVLIIIKQKKKQKQQYKNNNTIVYITSDNATLPSNSSNILINGDGFSSGSTIVLFSQANSGNNKPYCSSLQISPFNQIVCEKAQSLVNGALFAQVFAFGIYSRPNQTQIATIDDSPVVGGSNPVSLSAISSSQMSIFGSGFSPNYWENSVQLFGGKGQPISSSLFSISAASNETLLVLDLGAASIQSAIGNTLQNISAIVSKWSGERISSNQPILVSQIIPFVSSSIQNLATNIPSITINGFGFVSSIDNNTQIQVQLYQNQSTPSCYSIAFISASQIVCENPKGLIADEALSATVLIDGEWSSTFPTQIAFIMPQPTITTNSNNLGMNADFLTIQGANFDNTSFPASTATTQVFLSIPGSQNFICAIYSLTSTEIVCSNLSLQATGSIFATVSSFGGNSSSIEVAQIVSPPSIIIPSPLMQLFTNSTEFTLTVIGASTIASQNSIELSIRSSKKKKRNIYDSLTLNPTCLITSATSNSLTCSNLTGLEVGYLYANVFVYGGSSGWVEFANISLPPPPPLPQHSSPHHSSPHHSSPHHSSPHHSSPHHSSSHHSSPHHSSPHHSSLHQSKSKSQISGIGINNNQIVIIGSSVGAAAAALLLLFILIFVIFIIIIIVVVITKKKRKKNAPIYDQELQTSVSQNIMAEGLFVCFFLLFTSFLFTSFLFLFFCSSLFQFIIFSFLILLFSHSIR